MLDDVGGFRLLLRFVGDGELHIAVHAAEDEFFVIVLLKWQSNVSGWYK